MIFIDKFFVVKDSIYVPSGRWVRSIQCPHNEASKTLYQGHVDKSFADEQVKKGGSFCWSSCALTICPAYVANRK